MNKKKQLLLIFSILLITGLILFIRTLYWTALTKLKDQFIESNIDGNDFRKTFEKSMGMGVQEKWTSFMSHLV